MTALSIFAFVGLPVAGIAAHYLSSETQRNISFMPDAVLLGVYGSSRSVVKFVEKLILGTSSEQLPILPANIPMPETPFVGINGLQAAQFLAKISQACQTSVQIGLEIVLNMLSAQLSVFFTFGATISDPFSTPADSILVHSGVIYNLPNNSKGFCLARN